METNHEHRSFVNAQRAALFLGVPIAWLEKEAKEGRLPSLVAGRQRLYHVEEVERALLARARDESARIAGENLSTRIG